MTESSRRIQNVAAVIDDLAQSADRQAARAAGYNLISASAAMFSRAAALRDTAAALRTEGERRLPAARDLLEDSQRAVVRQMLILDRADRAEWASAPTPLAT